MLNLFRKNTKLIIWFTVGAMILWTGSSLLIGSNKNASYAGEIFGQKVKHKDYNNVYKMVNLFVQSGVSGGYSGNEQVWLYLALKHEAEKANIEVTDQEVVENINSLFGGNLAANPENYEKWVRINLKDQPRNFEEIVRDYIKIQKLFQQQIERLSKGDSHLLESKVNSWMQGLMQQANVKQYN